MQNQILCIFDRIWFIYFSSKMKRTEVKMLVLGFQIGFLYSSICVFVPCINLPEHIKFSKEIATNVVINYHWKEDAFSMAV